MVRRIGLIDALIIALAYLLCLCLPSVANVVGSNAEWIAFLIQLLFPISIFAFLGYRSDAGPPHPFLRDVSLRAA